MLTLDARQTRIVDVGWAVFTILILVAVIIAAAFSR